MKRVLFWGPEEVRDGFGEHLQRSMIRPVSDVDSKVTRSSCGEVLSAMTRKVLITSESPKQLLKRRSVN